MTKARFLTLTLSLALAALAGCDKGDEAQKGSAGESCQRRSDCGGGLACLDNRCVAEGSGGGDAGMEAVSGGKVGESCTRRSDCQPGLACFGQVCNTDNAVPENSNTDGRGDRGESCAAANDCRPGLACVNAMCRQSELELTTQAKQCYRVECAAAADCCVDFEPWGDALTCQGLKAACDGGDTFSCQDYYSTECTCPYTCSEEQCVTGACTSDTQCFGSRPFCNGTACVQCKATTDCTLYPGTTCVGGTCTEGCKVNEDCPLFYACQEGSCIDVGCSNDRECAFNTKNPDSKCVNKECITSCKSNAECGGTFNVCADGTCKFVGCETSEECRNYFGIATPIGGTRFGDEVAVCK